MAKSRPERKIQAKASGNARSKSADKRPENNDKPNEAVEKKEDKVSVPTTPPVDILDYPMQSPRDPNYYKVVQFANGVKAAIVRTCKFTDKTIESCERTPRLEKKASGGRIKVGAKSKCKRTQSDYETTVKKRSRANQKGESFKDLNCVELEVVEFNKEVLHLCEHVVDCVGGSSSAFACCGLFGDSDGNLSVESTGESDSTPQEASLSEKNQVGETEGCDDITRAKKQAMKFSKWSRNEDSEIPSDCSKSIDNNMATIAVTVPLSPALDPEDIPGLSDICKSCIRSCSGEPVPIVHEGTNTFVSYCSADELPSVSKCMASKFSQAQVEKGSEALITAAINKQSCLLDKLKEDCWKNGSTGILKNPKRLKLLSTFATVDHPIRKCAVGGNINMSLKEISRGDIDKALGEFLSKNFKPELLTVAISSNSPIDKIEKLVQANFGSIRGSSSGKDNNKTPENVVGLLNPFNTNQFKRLYKIMMCPVVCGNKCAKDLLTVSFALPPEAWKNYKTKPLTYLEYVVGHHGLGGLNYYLKKKNLITKMTAECPETPLHRSDFASLFEIAMTLTELGFKKYEMVLEKVFGYLRMLLVQGPQRHIFKDLQRIQSNKFHSLKKGLQDMKISSDTPSLSNILQFSRSKDLVMAPKVMIEYNGPILNEYLRLLVPENANIMVISNKFDQSMMTGEEPFLTTKYSAEDISGNLLGRFQSASVDSEFKVNPRNEFIPESFCILKTEDEQEPVKTKNNTPIHLDGDDFHDLYYLRDSRYYSVTGCLIHFVSPLSTEDTNGAIKTTLFYRLFKSMLKATLNPAVIADAKLKVQRTDYGIFFRIKANFDQLEKLLNTISASMKTFEENVSDNDFALQKKLLRQKICCDLKTSLKLAKDIERRITLSNVFGLPDFIYALENMTKQDFMEFITNFKNDLYFMLLVTGNVREVDAYDLAESLKLTDLVHSDPANKKLEEVTVCQWPLGNTYLKIRSLDPLESQDLILSQYQIGLASARNVVLSKLTQAMLQRFLAQSEDFAGEDSIATAHTTQIHNVIAICIQVLSKSGDNKLSPEDVEEQISGLLKKFYREMLCNLRPKELEDYKKLVLSCCQQKPFTIDNHISKFVDGIKNLSMDYLYKDSQLTCACERMKIKHLQDFFVKYFLPNMCVCGNEFRHIIIIVAGNKANEIPKQDKSEKVKPSKGCCTSKTCAEILDGNEKLDLVFENPNGSDCDGNGRRKKSDNGKIYITNLKSFKRNLFIYPSSILKTD